MNYKQLNFSFENSSFEFQNETSQNTNELCLSDFHNLTDILDNLKISDVINNEMHTVNYIKKLRKFIIEFHKRIKNFDVFNKYETIHFLVNHTDKKYECKIRQNAFLCLGSFLGAFPVLDKAINKTLFIYNMKDIISDYNNSNYKDVIPPIFLCLGNLIKLMNTNGEYETGRKIASELNIKLVINVAISNINNNSALYIMFFLNNLLNQSVIKYEQEIPNILDCIYQVLCSDLNQLPNLPSNSCNPHHFALNALYLFLSNNNFTTESRKELVIASNTYCLINRYFQINSIIKEQILAAKIIYSFYALDVKDIYQSLLKILELIGKLTYMSNLNVKKELSDKEINEYLASLLQTLSDIIDLKISQVLVDLYYNGIITLIINIFNSQIYHNTKSADILLLASYINACYPDHFHEFFLTPQCIEILLELLDDENNDYIIYVLDAINKIYEHCENIDQVQAVNEIMEISDGISIIESYTHHENMNIQNYAFLIYSFYNNHSQH